MDAATAGGAPGKHGFSLGFGFLMRNVGWVWVPVIGDFAGCRWKWRFWGRYGFMVVYLRRFLSFPRVWMGFIGKKLSFGGIRVQGRATEPLSSGRMFDRVFVGELCPEFF